MLRLLLALIFLVGLYRAFCAAWHLALHPNGAAAAVFLGWLFLLLLALALYDEISRSLERQPVPTNIWDRHVRRPLGKDLL